MPFSCIMWGESLLQSTTKSTDSLNRDMTRLPMRGATPTVSIPRDETGRNSTERAGVPVIGLVSYPFQPRPSRATSDVIDHWQGLSPAVTRWLHAARSLASFLGA